MFNNSIFGYGCFMNFLYFQFFRYFNCFSAFTEGTRVEWRLGTGPFLQNLRKIRITTCTTRTMVKPIGTLTTLGIIKAAIQESINR